MQHELASDEKDWKPNSEQKRRWGRKRKQEAIDVAPYIHPYKS
jgi:hypothetical protein